jgi:hypothetical protein
MARESSYESSAVLANNTQHSARARNFEGAWDAVGGEVAEPWRNGRENREQTNSIIDITEP